MKITALKEQVKNKNRVSVFMDGKYSFSLTIDQLLEYSLKKDSELDKTDVERFKKISEEGKQKIKALDWLLLRPHSVREFRDYGFRKKIEKDLVESWIEEFTTKRYLDDEQFARWFAENRLRKNKSKRTVVSELVAKGIELQVAKNIVDELGAGDHEAIRALAARLKTRTRYKDPQKLTAYLLSKGFSYSDVKEVLTPEHEP